MTAILLSLLGIVVVLALIAGYFAAYIHGIVLASKAGVGWIVACTLVSLIAICASLFHMITKKNIFLIINKRFK